jgi:hypothetical protein
MLDWRFCFRQGIKWDDPSSFGLWAQPLEASHYGHPSQEVVGVHGQKLNFGLGLWRLHTMHGQRLQSYILLVIFSLFLWTLDKVWPFNPMAIV